MSDFNTPPSRDEGAIDTGSPVRGEDLGGVPIKCCTKKEEMGRVVLTETDRKRTRQSTPFKTRKFLECITLVWVGPGRGTTGGTSVLTTRQFRGPLDTNPLL